MEADVDLQAVAHLGLVCSGHGHDPDEVLAAARYWLREHAGLTPIGARAEVPITALPSETWWGTYVVDNKEHADHGRTLSGTLQKHHGGRPITVVQVSEDLIADCPIEPTFDETEK